MLAGLGCECLELIVEEELTEEEAEEYECPECGATITLDMTSCPNCGVGQSFEDAEEEVEEGDGETEGTGDAEA